MVLWGPLLFLLLLDLSAAAFPAAPAADGSLFSPAESARLAGAKSLDDRIKVYESASGRMRETIEKLARREAFGAIPDALETWTSLLGQSLEDIRAHTPPGRKKSKRLIRYEIQVRKAVAGMKELKIKSPVELADAFDTFLARAESVRKEFIDILFLGK